MTADQTAQLPLTRDSIFTAHETIAPHINRTSLLQCQTLNRLASTPRTADGLARTQWAGKPASRPTFRFWFKCENMQRIGAFKARGALHAVKRLMQEPGFVEDGGLEKGVTTHSSGNHAQALSWAARENNMPAHIVMPRKSNPKKVAAARGYGAKITISGPKPEDREATCNEVIARTGARLIHPYDNPNIILGAGTVGLEFQEQFREANTTPTTTTTSNGAGSEGIKHQPDAVIAPCGGGGLLSGIALSCENTGIRVFGAEPSMSGANDVCIGFATGKRVEQVASRTVADGLRTPMGVLNWNVCYERRLVSAMYSVSDAEIMATARLVMERMKVVVEPSAVVGLAVALFDEDFRATVAREGGEHGWDVVVVLSGGNADIDMLSDQLKLADEVML
jgi:threonine dehydratase